MLGKNIRYRFKHGLVHHNGKLSRERLAFSGNEVVEEVFFPVKKKKKRR